MGGNLPLKTDRGSALASLSMLILSEVKNMGTDIDDMIFGDYDPGPSDR